MAEPRRVLVFGTSANPPTGLGGHAGLVTWAARRPDVDAVWVLPVYRHAFHEKRDLAPFEHRVEMARLAFEHLPGLQGRVSVLETEREVALRLGPGEKVGTIDVMRALVARHPDVGFTLLLGADTYRDLALGKWKESAALRALVSVLVVARVGVEVEAELPVERVPGLTDVSSSRVRASCAEAEKVGVLQPAVLEHIRRHHLYGFT